MSTPEQQRTAVAEVIVHAQRDDAYRSELLADIALRLPLPDGGELRLHQSAADEFLFVLPMPPDGATQLTEDDLDLVVRGGNGGDGGLYIVDDGLLGGNGGNGGLWTGG